VSIKKKINIIGTFIYQIFYTFQRIKFVVLIEILFTWFAMYKKVWLKVKLQFNKLPTFLYCTSVEYEISIKLLNNEHCKIRIKYKM